MATFIPTIHTGDIKAPAFPAGLVPSPSSIDTRPIFPPMDLPRRSDVSISFEVMSDLLAEAARAEGRLAMAWSWDPSAAGITAEDLEAQEAALFAAGALQRMPIGTVSDRPLVRVARFVLHCLTLDTPAERAEARLVLADPRTMFSIAGTQRMGRGMAAMIGTALHHLDALLAVGAAEALCLHDMSTDGGAAVPGDAVQEVQAF